MVGPCHVANWVALVEITDDNDVTSRMFYNLHNVDFVGIIHRAREICNRLGIVFNKWMI